MSKDVKDLSFAGNNPGAARFGNFINYYSFHSPNERTTNLNAKMFPTMVDAKIITVLDIGCNSGELTSALHIYLKTHYLNSKIKMLAIDIDPSLIVRAKEQYSNDDVSFNTTDISTDDGCEKIKEFLKSYTKDKFDIIFCFSVTMWIHINTGDEGFVKFLNFMKDNSKTIIIEPQPWKCYKNAQRRMKKSGKHFELYNLLSIRDNIDIFIEKCISESHVKVYESPSSSWNRKIQSFVLQP